MTAAALPAELRERVLTAARAARAAGRPLPELPHASPVEAFGRAVDGLTGLLTALPDGVWHRPVLRDLDVQGLVGHLTGVEQDVQRALAGSAAVASVDHVRSTQQAAEREAGRSPADTVDGWRDAAARTLAAVRGRDLADPVAVHGLRLPLGALLVVRSFELWTHEDDIRAVAGLPASVPDAPVLRLMTDLVARLLPAGVARVCDHVPAVDVHLVLTGAGGGTWDVVLGARDRAEVPDVAIVADAVAFCRLVAARIPPAELGAHVSGASEHAARVLAGAAALALD